MVEQMVVEAASGNADKSYDRLRIVKTERVREWYELCRNSRNRREFLDKQTTIGGMLLLLAAVVFQQ